MGRNLALLFGSVFLTLTIFLGLDILLAARNLIWDKELTQKMIDVYEKDPRLGWKPKSAGRASSHSEAHQQWRL
jgi:hypothetical protein